jgi:SpoU rRNA methylase family enzyme
MSNMDITKKHSTEINKDEQHGHHQNTVMFFGDVGHVAHLYIFLCYVFGNVNVVQLYIFL